MCRMYLGTVFASLGLLLACLLSLVFIKDGSKAKIPLAVAFFVLALIVLIKHQIRRREAKQEEEDAKNSASPSPKQQHKKSKDSVPAILIVQDEPSAGNNPASCGSGKRHIKINIPSHMITDNTTKVTLHRIKVIEDVLENRK